MFGPPRPRRRTPLTPLQRRVLRLMAAGNRLVDDCFGPRLEPIGCGVPRLTLRALVRAGLVEDPGTPLFNPAAGQLTRHGHACADLLTLGES
jgi:hypothetical protein